MWPSAAAPRSAHPPLADDNETALEAMAEQLRGEGYEVTTQATDVPDYASVVALADAAAALGPVAGVIHAAGVSPVQASTERVRTSTSSAPPTCSRSSAASSPPAAPGSSWPAWPGTWGRATPARSKLALAYTPTADLLGLDFLDPAAVGDSGAAYTLAKRANALRVRAAAVTWGERGALVNCISPGIISTPSARDEMSGPFAEGYRNMIHTSRRAGWARCPTWPTRPPCCSVRTAPSSRSDLLDRRRRHRRDARQRGGEA